MTDLALTLIVLLPLVGAIVNGVFGRGADNRSVSIVAIGAVLAAFVCSVFCVYQLSLLEEGAVLRTQLYEWFTLKFGQHEIPIGVTFVMDRLSAVMTLFVTGIGTLIHIYSMGYMSEDPGYARFFTYLNLFMASMLILVLGSSMPLLFVGWEGVGLCSYLLIGFWYENADYAAAGKKAFIMNRIGDFGVIIGMFILMQASGSLEMSDINRAAERGALTPTFELPGPQMLGVVTGAIAVLLVLGAAAFVMHKVKLSPAAWLVALAVLGGALYVLFVVSPTVSLATAACLFIFLGCTGKSAQIPLFVWLPDAMAGPTPVSALIHAATMVTAGVYLCCRLSYVFMASPTAMMVITIVGALTALLAASIALVQNQMKKILAYSTVSQLGFMFAAVGAGAFKAGIFHVFTHAFFKACLFLGAGAVMHAVHAHGDADVRLLGGMRKHLPTVHWTFLVSCLAIAGFPLTSGFFSKDEILLGVLSSSEFLGSANVAWFVFGVLVLSATMTAFYMFRLYFLTFAGEYRSAISAPADGAHAGDDHHGHAHGYDPHPHAPSASIAAPLIVLGLGALFAGYVNAEPLQHILHMLGMHAEGDWNFWGEWLGASVAGVHGEPLVEIAAPLGGFLAMAIGIGSAWAMYGNGKRMPKEHPTGLHALLLDKWKVDELYEAVVVWPMRWTARFAGALDKYFVDMLLARVSAGAVQVGGYVLSRMQNGIIFVYGTVMVLGLLVLGAWMVLPHPRLKATVDGEKVTLKAARGHGYVYRWDLGGDGHFDGEFAAGAFELEHTYTSAERAGLVVRFEPGLVGDLTTHDEEVAIPHGAHYSVRESLLGEGWTHQAHGAKVPTMSVEGEDLVIHPNDAIQSQETIRLKYGESAQLGNAMIHIGALVRPTVEVRNAFGVRGKDCEEVHVFPSPEKTAGFTGELR